MGVDLGDFVIGSPVQLSVEYEDINGSALTPTNPKYTVHKLDTATGSYYEQVEYTTLNNQDVGLYGAVYNSGIGGRGQFRVIYVGSINNSPYDDVDTFRVVSPVATGGGGGELSGTEIGMLKKLTTISTKSDIGSLNHKIDTVVEFMAKAFESALTQEELDEFTGKINFNVKEEVSGLKDSFEVKEKIMIAEFKEELDTANKNTNKNFKKIEKFLNSKFDKEKETTKESFNITKKAIDDLNSEMLFLKTNLNTVNNEIVGFKNDTIKEFKNVSKFKNNFKNVDNDIAKITKHIDVLKNNINITGKNIELLNIDFNKNNISVFKELDNVQTSNKKNYENLKERFNTYVMEQFSDKDVKDDANIKMLKDDINKNLNEIYINIDSNMNKSASDNNMKALEQEQRIMKLKQLINIKFDSINTIMNKHYDELSGNFNHVDSDNREIREKMMYKFGNIKKDMSELKEELMGIVKTENIDAQSNITSKIKKIGKKMSDFELKQQISMLK